MFERNRIETTLQTTAAPVEIALADGRVEKGRFIISAARSLQAILNSDVQFLEFETYDGERALVAKSALRAVKVIDVPVAGSLKTRLRETGGFEPYAMLGLERGASWEDVRRAYLALSKTYHPDRYAGAALPPEVRDYFSAMIGRINAAYAALEASHLVAKEATKQVVPARAKAVYTSPSRS